MMWLTADHRVTGGGGHGLVLVLVFVVVYVALRRLEQ